MYLIIQKHTFYDLYILFWTTIENFFPLWFICISYSLGCLFCKKFFSFMFVLRRLKVEKWPSTIIHSFYRNKKQHNSLQKCLESIHATTHGLVSKVFASLEMTLQHSFFIFLFKWQNIFCIKRICEIIFNYNIFLEL